MRIAAKIVGITALVWLAGAYFQLGLYLTSFGTPFPIMHGLGQWLAWVCAPLAIGAVLINELTE